MRSVCAYFLIVVSVSSMVLQPAWAQEARKTVTTRPLRADSVTEDRVRLETILPDTLRLDSVISAVADSVRMDSALVLPDSVKGRYSSWKPDPIRAMWLSMVFPGGGQIYNRKFWKLPIVYGGVIGCIYAITWNGQMMRDYSQAWQDITDDDPNTKSYEEMLPLNYPIAGRESKLADMFKRKKDFYRRYRDLSIFFMVGVYILSVVDAYVDAELSTFDISKDLSLQWKPTFIRNIASTDDGRFGSPAVSLTLTY